MACTPVLSIPLLSAGKKTRTTRRNKLVFLTPAGEEFKEQIRPVLD